MKNFWLVILIILSTLFISILIIFINYSPKDKYNKFDNIYRTAKSIQGAISVGVTFPVYRELLQKYATELLIIKNNTLIGDELKLFYLHKEALETYLDAQRIWTVKIESPKYKWVPENRIFPLVGITSIISKYGIEIDEIKDSSGRKWTTISTDSIQFLWSKAEPKIIEADKLQSQIKQKNFLENIMAKVVPKI